MREVTRDEFYNAIRDMNVHPRIVGRFPYTSLFLMPSGYEVGFVVGSLPRGSGSPVRRYYLCEEVGDEST